MRPGRGRGRLETHVSKTPGFIGVSEPLETREDEIAYKTKLNKHNKNKHDRGEEEPGSHPSGSKTERDRRQAEKSQRRGRGRDRSKVAKLTSI